LADLGVKVLGQPASRSRSLADRVTARRGPVEKNSPFSDLEIPIASLGPGFGLYNVDAAVADNNVIKVESICKDVVKDSHTG
jgi:hypothetical protein